MKTKKKLSLKKETVEILTQKSRRQVKGGCSIGEIGHQSTQCNTGNSYCECISNTCPDPTDFCNSKAVCETNNANCSVFTCTITDINCTKTVDPDCRYI